MSQYLSNLLGQTRQVERFLNKSIAAFIKNCLGLTVNTISAGEQRKLKLWIKSEDADPTMVGPRLTKAHLSDLKNYDWPGNVRELRNLIERSVITLQSDTLYFDLHPKKFGNIPMKKVEFPSNLSNSSQILTESEMQGRIRENMRAALKSTDGKIYGPGGAAEKLGIKPTTLCARLNKWDLK